MKTVNKTNFNFLKQFLHDAFCILFFSSTVENMGRTDDNLQTRK